MLRKIVFGLLANLILLSGVAFAGEKYAGKWGGTARTSIEIISSKEVIYCYRGDCGSLRPSGNLNNMSFRFAKNGNFPGAEMTMIKKGNKYFGEYILNGQSNIAKATLVKQ